MMAFYDCIGNFILFFFSILLLQVFSYINLQTYLRKYANLTTGQKTSLTLEGFVADCVEIWYKK